jgi:hypothetical protein
MTSPPPDTEGLSVEAVAVALFRELDRNCAGDVCTGDANALQRGCGCFAPVREALLSERRKGWEMCRTAAYSAARKYAGSSGVAREIGRDIAALPFPGDPKP